jgi:gluconolactonase
MMNAATIRRGLPVCVLFLSGCAGEHPEPFEEGAAAVTQLGVIERVDPRFDELVPADAVIEQLADGFDWSEGPAWIPDGGFLVFSDVPQNVVYKWAESEGISEFLRPSGFTGTGESGREPGSNGLLLDLKSQLILCQHGDRRVSRLNPDNSFEELVSTFEGKRFNSPNDAVLKSNGDLYFTDPPYGLTGLNDSPLKELDFNGVYRLSATGELTLLTSELTFPNGVALSPDEKTLYVAVSDPDNPVIMAYDVKSDGTIENGRVFFDTGPWSEKYPGLPDGLKVDQKGNVFATGPGGVNVFDSAGTFLGRFNTGVATANCGWGDDGSTLYITADAYLCRVKLRTTGLVHWVQ